MNAKIALLTLFAFGMLLGCGTSAPPPLPPVTQVTNPDSSPSDFYKYNRKYFEQKNLLESQYNCSINNETCPNSTYPKLKSQMEELSRALELAQQIQKLKYFFDEKLPKQIEFITKTLEQKKVQILKIEAKLPALENQLKLKEQQRVELAKQIESKMCQVVDQKNWSVKLGEPRTIEDVQSISNAIAVLKKIKVSLLETDGLYASSGVENPNAQSYADSNLLSTINVWQSTCPGVGGVLLGRALQDLVAQFKALNLTYDNSPWTYEPIDCADSSYDRLKEKLDTIQRFKDALTDAQPYIDTAALDSAQLALPLDSRTKKPIRYDSKTAYDFSPASEKGLRIVLPLTSNAQSLKDFFRSLDRVDDPRFKARSQSLKAIQAAAGRFPITITGRPLHATIGLDRDALESALERLAVQDILSLLTNLPESLRANLKDENLNLAWPKYAKDYSVPSDVLIHVWIGGGWTGCSESVDQNGKWAFATDFIHKDDLGICIPTIVVEHYRKK